MIELNSVAEEVLAAKLGLNFQNGVYTGLGANYPSPENIPGWSFSRPGTNLLLQSQTFDNASWIKNDAAITANAGLAPDGTETADLLLPTANNNTHGIAQTFTVATEPVTVSFHVKPAGYIKWGIREESVSGNYIATDLTGIGSVLATSVATATVVLLSSGYYRISFTHTPSTSGARTYRLFTLSPAYTTGAVNTAWLANGTSGGYLWGAQAEPGSVANAYQPTTTAAITNAPVTYAEGLVDDIVTNKVTAWNANPTEAAGFVGNPVGITKAGDAAAVLSVVDDTAALAAAGLSGVCTSGKVYKLDNSAGTVTAIANMVALPGNTNTHVQSVYARGGVGNCAMASTNNSSVAITSSATYVRRVGPGGATTAVNGFYVTAYAGQIVYFILPQLIERTSAISLDIVTQGAAASAVVGRVNGLIPFAANTPRITDKGLLVEGAATNLCQDTFNAAPANLWTTLSTASIAVGTLAPRLTGATVTQMTITSTSGRVQRNLGFTGPDTLSRTFAVDVEKKAATVEVSTGLVGGAGVSATIIFNAATGVISSGAGTVSDAGPNWWRVSVTVTNNNTANATWYAYLSLVLSSSGQTLQVSIPQFEIGSQATSYVPTTTAAATRAADNASITGLGAILGQFRTNLLPYSTPTSGQWNTSTAGLGSAPTVTYGAATAPDGTLSAARVQFALNGGSAGSDQSNFNTNGVAYQSVVQYTQSFWLKSNTASDYVVIIATASGQQAIITVTPNWQRFTVTHLTSAAASAGGAVRLRGGFGTADTADILVWGAQFETGPVATAYIPTTTAPVTVGNPFTMQAWADFNAVASVSARLASANDGTGLNVVQIARASAGQMVGQTAAAGTVQTSAGPSATGSAIRKTALRQRVSDFRFVSDGVGYGPYVIAGPTGLSIFDLGVQRSAAHLNGYLQRVVIYGDLTDAQLTRITQ